MSLAHTQVTFHYERLCAAATGIMAAAGTTFLLLIAVRHFGAGPTAKALIAASRRWAQSSIPTRREVEAWLKHPGATP